MCVCLCTCTCVCVALEVLSLNEDADLPRSPSPSPAPSPAPKHASFLRVTQRSGGGASPEQPANQLREEHVGNASKAERPDCYKHFTPRYNTSTSGQVPSLHPFSFLHQFRLSFYLVGFIRCCPGFCVSASECCSPSRWRGGPETESCDWL